MTKIVLFYFSGTGNTKWVCETVANYLSEQERNDLMGLPLSIEHLNRSITSKFTEAADVLGIVFPIYGGAPPKAMTEFIKTIPPARKKQKALIICTQSFFSFSGGDTVRDILASKGYSVDWCAHIKMPNSLCVHTFPYSVFKYSDEPEYIKPFLSKAENKIAALCDKIIHEKKYLQGFSMLSRATGSAYRFLAKDYFHGKLSIMNKNCTDCGICSQTCPMKCIKSVDGYKTIGKECTGCMKCYNLCPNNDILFDGAPLTLKHGTPYRGPKAEVKFNSALLKITKETGAISKI